jgi:hypothetical protein
VNQEEVIKLYSQLWDEYISENPDLLKLIRDASGLSDMFGQEGHCCQATELWRIRNDTTAKLPFVGDVARTQVEDSPRRKNVRKRSKR